MSDAMVVEQKVVSPAATQDIAPPAQTGVEDIDIGGVDDPDMDLAIDFFANKDNNDELSVVPTAEETATNGSDPAPGQSPTVVLPPPVETPPVGTQPGAPAATVAAETPPPTVVAPPVPQSSQAAQATPAANPEEVFQQLSTIIAQQKPAIVEAVAAGSYQLSQADVEAIQTEPEKILPRLMAQVHVNAVQAVMAHVAQQIGPTVMAHVQVSNRHRELEDSFYAQWPGLNRAVHGELVTQVGRNYRAMNPNATVEEFTRFVGAQALAMAGGGVVAAPTVPAKVQRPPAFTPAAPGRVAQPPAPARAQQNEWERFSEIIDADERGVFESR